MPRLHQTVADALTRGIVHHRAGRIEHAEEIYRQVLAQSPEQFDALHLLGLIAHQRGDQGIALREITRAISINDRSAKR